MAMAVQGTDDARAVIVGAGFGALSAAVALHKVGVPSVVLEKSRHARSEGFSIGTFTNGWRALDELGVGDAIRSEHINTVGVRYYFPSGNVIQEFEFSQCTPPPHRDTHEVRVVMREAIPRHLTKELPPGTVHYEANVIDATADSTGAEVTLEGGEKLRGRFVVLADGVHSQTAFKYHKAPLEYMHNIGWRAIVTMDADEIPSRPHAQFAQGNGVRIGFFPAKFDAERKKLTWYWFMACAAKEDENFGDMAQQKETMQQLVKGWKVCNFQELLEATPLENIKLSKIYQRQVKPGQSWFEGCMTGVGDSCHATTPFLGQGGAMALESGVELGVFIKEAMKEAGDVPFAQLAPEALCKALRKYETVRSYRVDYLITKSRNFGNTFRKPGLLASLLMWLGLWKPLRITPETFLEHAVWEPSGSLNPDKQGLTTEAAKHTQHVEE